MRGPDVDQTLACSPPCPSSWQLFVRARQSGLVHNKELAALLPVTLYGDMKRSPLTPRVIQVAVLSHRSAVNVPDAFPASIAAVPLWRVSAGAAKTLVTFVFVSQ